MLCSAALTNHIFHGDVCALFVCTSNKHRLVSMMAGVWAALNLHSSDFHVALTLTALGPSLCRLRSCRVS